MHFFVLGSFVFISLHIFIIVAETRMPKLIYNKYFCSTEMKMKTIYVIYIFYMLFHLFIFFFFYILNVFVLETLNKLNVLRCTA